MRWGVLVTAPYQAPSFNYWLGTDGLGEPVAARLLDATGHTVFAVTLAVCIAALIARAMILEPELLILDEPSASLDPASIEKLISCGRHDEQRCAGRRTSRNGTDLPLKLSSTES